MQRPFSQVDVFSPEPFSGNPVAFVLDGEGLSTEEMQRFARWTNLSETTFLLPPADPRADYQVRIFTPAAELPFAGHPTLGTCHAWLAAGHEPRRPGLIIQQCAAGLVTIRQHDERLGFAAPPTVRSGPVDELLISEVADQLRVPRAGITGSQWADNGPGWIAVMLPSAEAVLGLNPDLLDRDVGVAGPYPAGSECAYEVRAFFLVNGRAVEDPVTGSFNASLAQWLLASGQAAAPYVVSQGTAIGRRGRVHIDQDADGVIWVSGDTWTKVTGEADI